MKDIPDILDGLKRSPRVLANLVATIPAERMGHCRGAHCWTIAEHVCHLAEVQPMLTERLQRFRDEPHPVFVPYIPGEGETEPDTPAVIPTDQALERFARYRDDQIGLLADTDEATWQKSGSHPEYALYSFYILTRHILMHDHWHMYRMEELWLTRDAYLTTVT